jgi:hypothetical protein
VTRVPGASKVGSVLIGVDRERSMSTWFQYRDPLIGILDYIVEVRTFGHDCSRSIYLAGPKRNVPMTP